MSKPAPDELEISIFGPGGGECTVLHLGSDVWAVVDSCVSNKTPVAATYLEALGVDLAAVQLILVTHWHDDHIRGMGALVEQCTNARVAFPMAFLSDEFGDLVGAFELAHLGSFSDGLSEIRSVLTQVEIRGNYRYAIEERPLWAANPGALAHGLAAEVRALSPPDWLVSNMLKELALKMPEHADAMYRIESNGRNDVSAAAWVSVGPVAALLGADVETTTNAKTGWDGILAARAQVATKANVFKVPHHGSFNGHHGKVWTDLLDQDPITVVTPWQRGGGLLPQHADIVRLLAHSKHVFATSVGTLLKARKRLPAVERTIRDNGYSLTSIEGKVGQVRLRAKPGAPWNVELIDAAAQM